MSDATQTATTTDARQASMSRVQTQDTILANLAPSTATSEQKPENSEEPGAGKQDDGEQKPKKSAQDRIRELANRNRETEARAEAAERRARELEAQVRALSATAPPLEEKPRPQRHAFSTQEEFEDAVGEWKAEQILRKREEEQRQARLQAEQQAIAANWEKYLEAAAARIPDLAEVIGKSETSVPAHVHQYILESEQGPEIAYYLALHPDEAKRIASMRPIAAVKALDQLEKDLKDIESDVDDGKDKGAKDDKTAKAETKVTDSQTPKKSKAPPPVDPVKSAASSGGTGQSSTFQDYKRRRQAQQTQ